MRYFFIFLCLVLSSTLDAEWDDLPSLHLESQYKLKPPGIGQAPERQPSIEHQYGAKDRYTAAEGGYYLTDFNYASTSHGEYQAFFFGIPSVTGGMIRLDYLNQFGDQAFAYTIDGYYISRPYLRIGLTMQFSPKETLVTQHGYKPYIEVGLFNNRLVMQSSYQYQSYREATKHGTHAGFDFYFARWLMAHAVYRWHQITPSGQSSTTNHGFRTKVVGFPMDGVTVYGQYAFINRDFAPGETTPFEAFRAHEAGGGFSFRLVESSGLYFDVIHHNRNNGESYIRYNLGTFASF
jgi:hypothetical protein